MSNLESNNMDTGAPGLLLLASSWILQWIHLADRATITFYGSTVATLLAIIYYLIQIKKTTKK